MLLRLLFFSFLLLKKYHFQPNEVSINKLLSRPSNLIEFWMFEFSLDFSYPFESLICSTLEVGRKAFSCCDFSAFDLLWWWLSFRILKASTIIFNIATGMNTLRLPFGSPFFSLEKLSMMRQFDKVDWYMTLFIPHKQDVGIYKLFSRDKEHNDSTDILTAFPFHLDKLCKRIF